MQPRYYSRLEDVLWMAATGEHARGAARRLGMTEEAFEKWCRNNAPDAWNVLRARQPRDHNRHDSRHNQWSAA